jgi:hypothetical protein
MNPLYEYIARQVGERIKARSVVVWYDARREFAPFVDELRDGAPAQIGPIDVPIGGSTVALVSDMGSMFEMRAAVETLMAGDQPDAMLVYVPELPPDPTTSVLMELEKAGTRYEPQLKQLARNFFRQTLTDGDIDKLVERAGVTYEDLARASAGDGGSDPPSVLKGIFHEAGGRQDELVALWVTDPARDAAIEAKEAVGELARLIESRIGLPLNADHALSKLRMIVVRYVLVGEFRDDLKAEPPPAVNGIPAPKTKAQIDAVRALAQRLRSSYPSAYIELADDLEQSLGLADAGIAADRLGSIDTFRFEEAAVRRHVEELIAGGKYDEAERLISERERSFWLDQDVSRRAQWQACRFMVQLGRIAAEVLSESSSAHGDPDSWIRRYTERESGWYRLDQAQRRLETLVASLDEDPAEKAIGLVRRAYEDAANRLADRFVPSLAKAGWTTAATMHQTRVFADAVSAQPKPVAYFLVDAMRYEMGVELAERLPASAEATIAPAVAALPSITPIGMGALMPGAAASFDIADVGAKFGSRIEGSFLPDLPARRKFADAQVPGLLDITLAEVLGTSASKLETRLKDTKVVIVRSQEIDAAGEGGFFQARRTMDTVIDDLVRAIKKLAAAGVRTAVVSADHGHLFSFGDRGEAERADAPGGATVDLHRRCWIGRGGTTPPGCMRVSASTLGYDSDLDLVFPPGTAVFKAGGDLGFHHGGPTLQELIVPVVTVRSASPVVPPKASPATVSDIPYEITNRIFSVVVKLGSNLTMFSSAPVVQPMLISAGSQVGRAAMAVGADVDPGSGTIALAPGTPVTVGFMLTDDSVKNLRIVILDPATDAELYRSPHDIPVNLGVA